MGVIRVLPDDQIEDLLANSIIGRIACCGHGQHGEGRPYLVPIAYGYDGESVYAHSAPGRKLDLMQIEPRVTFEVDEGTAPDHWRSVIAECVFEEIKDSSMRDAALLTIYGNDEFVPELAAEVVVFRLQLTAKSGRYELPE